MSEFFAIVSVRSVVVAPRHPPTTWLTISIIRPRFYCLLVCQQPTVRHTKTAAVAVSYIVSHFTQLLHNNNSYIRPGPFCLGFSFPYLLSIFQVLPFNLFPSAFYLLPSTFYLLPSTFYLLPFAFYLLPFAFNLLPLAFRLLPFAFHLLPSTFYLLPSAFCLCPLPTAYYRLLLPAPPNIFFPLRY